MNHTTPTPPEGNHLDVFRLIGKAQADIATIRAILALYTDQHEDPTTEPLYGVITLLDVLKRDLEPLYAMTKQPAGRFCKHSLEAFHLINDLPEPQREEVLSGFRGVVCALGGKP